MNVLNHLYAQFIDYAPRLQLISDEYKALLIPYSNTIDQFIPELSTEQKNLFLELESQRNLIAAADEENMFRYGFTIGMRVILEVLYGSERSF